MGRKIVPAWLYLSESSDYKFEVCFYSINSGRNKSFQEDYSYKNKCNAGDYTRILI